MDRVFKQKINRTITDKSKNTEVLLFKLGTALMYVKKKYEIAFTKHVMYIADQKRTERLLQCKHNWRSKLSKACRIQMTYGKERQTGKHYCCYGNNVSFMVTALLSLGNGRAVAPNTVPWNTIKETSTQEKKKIDDGPCKTNTPACP
ncbi:hypothetical protein P5673_009982 [Acropora cervicornis]|uniref:Uncharacterized protein n=1 Tax=Acropora cervicornis TaxID=6130 RepID=A0AAD9VA17_ACRCE|nr:hypothetical protein P5673_009982 [Acropora cervicornis]